MINQLFDGPGMGAARSALTGLSRRQEVIADNIANIDTPGYRRKQVDFKSALLAVLNGRTPRPLLSRTNARHLASSGAATGGPQAVTERLQISGRADGNSVSIEEDMALLAETQIRFQALAQSIGRRLTTLRTVIRG